MKETDENALKAEIDEISRNIDDIMKRVEAAVPPSPKDSGKDTSEDTPPEDGVSPS